MREISTKYKDFIAYRNSKMEQILTGFNFWMEWVRIAVSKKLRNKKNLYEEYLDIAHICSLHLSAEGYLRIMLSRVAHN